MSYSSKRVEVVNHISNKGLASRTYKEVSKLNKNTYRPIKKWTKDNKRHFTEDDIQIAKKGMKRYLTTFAIREIQL